MADTNHEKLIEAAQNCARWLGDANEAAEAGKHEKAEKLYKKVQYWLDRYNKLAGNH
jgi:prephenate dehydrogenase